MCGIGQKPLLGGDRILQPVQQIVHRRHQRRDLQWHRAVFQRAQVVRLALAYALFQLLQRLDAARQRQPHQQHCHGQDHELRQHHALDDLGGQHRALFAGFGHLHQHRLGLGGPRARAGRNFQADPHIRDPDIHATNLVVSQAYIADLRADVIPRRRKVFFARNQFTARPQRLEIDHVGIIGAQDLARGLRQVELDLTLIDHDQLGQRLHVVLERAVKRLSGDALRHQPGQAQAEREEQQQRGQHPVQDLPEQRALLALEYFHPLACARRSFPCNSPVPGRSQCGWGLFRSSCAGGGYRPRSRYCSLPRPIRTVVPPTGPC